MLREKRRLIRPDLICFTGLCDASSFYHFVLKIRTRTQSHSRSEERQERCFNNIIIMRELNLCVSTVTGLYETMRQAGKVTLSYCVVVVNKP